VKKNWLLYLVIFSLALNFGTIGTLVYLRYQEHRPPGLAEPPPLPLRALWGELRLDQAQRQALRGLFPEHHRKVLALRQELGQKRQEFFELMKSEAPSWEAIRGKVKEISSLQGSLEEEMARFLLELKKNLRPEQQAAFVSKMQARLGCEAGGPGGACGPLGPGNGPRRGGMGMGRGMGPHGSGPHPGPPPPGPPGGPGVPE
jgi:Spy/CpxP family protein refolding chaperone